MFAYDRKFFLSEMIKQRKREFLFVIFMIAGLIATLSSASGAVLSTHSQENSEAFACLNGEKVINIDSTSREVDFTSYPFYGFYYAQFDTNKKSHDDHCIVLSGRKCNKFSSSFPGSENPYPKSLHSRAFFCEFRT